MIGVDSTVLTLLVNPNSDSPPDPNTGKPVERARDRVEYLVETLHKEKQKIIIPTPVLSEVLVRSGAVGIKYIEILQKAAVFEIRPFDTLAAIELALLTEHAIKTGDKRGGRNEAWQRIKLDRQIVAICKVAGVQTLYATDGPLTSFAISVGISVIGVSSLPLPSVPPQLALNFVALDATEGTDEPNVEELDQDGPEDESEAVERN